MLAIFSAHVIGAQERETVPLKPKYRTLRLIITAECISPRANRSTPLPMHGTASASPSPSDATRAPWDGGREHIPGTWEPPPSPPTIGRAGGHSEAGPTTGRRRQRVAAEAATPPGVVTLTRPHAMRGALRGRRRRNRGRRSVGCTSSIRETLFLKNCTTKGNNYLIGEREGSEGKALKDGSKIRLEQYQQFRR